MSHREQVHALARRLVPCDQVDDVVQQTWLRVLEHPPKHGAAPRAWLHSIVRSVASRLHATERRRADLELEETGGDRVDECDRFLQPHEELERKSEQRQLMLALRALDQRYAEVIHARFFKELNPGEIAEQLELPVDTVYTRLRRGLHRLESDLNHRRSGKRFAFQWFGLASLWRPKSLRSNLLAKTVLGPNLLTIGSLILVSLLGFVWNALAVMRDQTGLRVPVVSTVVQELGASGALLPSELNAELRRDSGAVLASEEAVVTVWVQDKRTGKPLEGVVVFAEHLSSGSAFRGRPVGPGLSSQQSSAHQSNSIGRVVFKALSPGSWEFVETSGSSKSLMLAAGERLEITLFVDPGTPLRGSVVRGGGVPVPGAELWIRSAYRNDHGVLWGIADAKGEYELERVPDGVWLSAHHPGMRPSLYTWVPPASDESGSGGRGEVLLALRELGQIKGRVVDPFGQPVAGARVWAEPRRAPVPRLVGSPVRLTLRPPMEVAVTNRDGFFDWPSMVLGACDLWVKAEGYQSSIVPLNLLAWEEGLGGEENPLELQLYPSGGADKVLAQRVIQGQAFDHRGEPWQGALVLAEEIEPGLENSVPDPLTCFAPRSQARMRVLTAAEGRFEFANCADSDYRLWLLAEGDSTGLSATWLDLRASSSEAVTLRAEVHGGAIKGTIADSGCGRGERFVLLTAKALPLSIKLPLMSPTQMTEASFQADHLPAGEYQLYLLGDNLQQLERSVELRENEQLDLGQHFVPAKGRLRLALEREDGLPLETAVVTLEDPLGQVIAWRAARHARSKDKQPRQVADFEGLSPGRYEILVKDEKLAAVSLAIELRPGEELERSLKLLSGREQYFRFEGQPGVLEKVTLRILNSARAVVFDRSHWSRSGQLRFEVRLAPAPYIAQLVRTDGSSAEFSFEVPSESSGPQGGRLEAKAIIERSLAGLFGAPQASRIESE